MLASWELPKIPLDLDMALFFNFPGYMGSFQNFRELPLDFPEMLASWEISKISLDFDMAVFFNFLGSIRELPLEFLLASFEIPKTL